MNKAILSLILFCLLICGCGLSDPDDVAKSEIRDKLQAIELGFNLNHLDEIMENYSSEYLHDGDDFEDMELYWEIKLNDYQEIEITDIQIELDDDKAEVSLSKKYKNNGVVVLLEQEPADTENLSYWQTELGNWLLMGNQVSGW